MADKKKRSKDKRLVTGMTRTEAQVLADQLNAHAAKAENLKAPKPARKRDRYVAHSDYHVTGQNTVQRIRVRGKRLDQINKDKLELAYWLKAKREAREKLGGTAGNHLDIFQD